MRDASRCRRFHTIKTAPYQVTKVPPNQKPPTDEAVDANGIPRLNMVMTSRDADTARELVHSDLNAIVDVLPLDESGTGSENLKMKTVLGFRETPSGVYETTTVLPHGGKYDVPILVGSDEFIQCFSISADTPADQTSRHAGPSIHIEGKGQPVANARRGGTSVFRITDSDTGRPATGLSDMRLLAFSSSGTWQSRQCATELGNGRYAGRWTFFTQGRYGLSIEVASREFSFADQAPIYLKVRAPEDGVAPASQSGSAQ